jgi:aldehyde dehydrogenase (NAD+)
MATASSVAATPVETVPDLVTRVRSTFDTGRTRPIEWRRSQLAALDRLLADHGADLVDALAADMGKPPVEAHFTDIGFTRAEVKHLHRHVADWARPRPAKLRLQDRPGRGEVVPEPLGVSLVIAPWNYPVQLTLSPLAATLAAGNAVVLKPSELVPATSTLLGDLLASHLDPDAVAVVQGGPDVSTALLEQRFDHIFFTGSTTVGRVVAEAAARHLTPTVLELGGKSPVIVADDADLDISARRIAWGKALNAGQTCIAPDYVLATAATRDALVDRIVSSFERHYGPRPETSADLAGIVSERHLDRLRGLLDGHGGTVACGGTIDAATRKLAPTVVVDPDPSSPLMRDEIFGPILPVVTVEDLDEAITFVNARPKPLALYVFAGDDRAVTEVTERTSSGGVCANHVMFHIGPPELPFGGVGASGWGRYHGRSGVDALSNLKPVLRRPIRPELTMIYPPYTKLKSWLLSR